MKKITFIYFFIFSCFCFSNVLAQDIDERLLVKYSKSEIESIKRLQPEHYQFLINALDRGVFISEIPFEKNENIAFDGTLTIDINESHNFLTIRKEITDKYQYYKIAGTTKMLVILPKIFLDPELQKQIKTKQ